MMGTGRENIKATATDFTASRCFPFDNSNSLPQNQGMEKQPQAICSIPCFLIIISLLLPTAGCISTAARQQKIDAYEASGKCYQCKGSGEVDCPQCKNRGWITCPDCSGSGKKFGEGPIDTDSTRRCSNCLGSGQIQCPTCDGLHVVSCDRCGGTGIAP